LISHGVPPLAGVRQGRGGVNISKTVRDTSKVILLVTNRKVHMRFRLAPRSVTLDDLELYKFAFSENFSGFRRFRTQQQLNVWT